MSSLINFDSRTAGGGFGYENDAWNTLAVTGEIFDKFVEGHPEVRAIGEVRSAFAGKLCQVACRLAGSRRPEALVTFACARRFDAATARSFAGKFFSLLLFGERARALLNPAAGQGQRVL